MATTLEQNLQEIQRQKELYLKPDNIKKDVEVLGITGDYTFNLQNKTVAPSSVSQIVEADNGYDGLSSVSVNGDINLIANNIKKNVTIFGTTGTLPTESDILDTYYTRTLTNSKYKYSDILKKNPQLSTSSLTTMQDMFAESDLQEIDTTGFSTSSVTNMSGMCKNCSKLTTFNGTGLNTSNVTDMSEMFKDCTNLSAINFSGWNVAKITDMSEMFSGCTSLTGIDLSGFNTSSALTDTSNMFYGCSNVTSINLKGLNYSNISDSTDMFTGVPQDCRIVVSNQATKDWVLSVRSDLTDIHIVTDFFLARGSYQVAISYDGVSWQDTNNNMTLLSLGTNGVVLVKCIQSGGDGYLSYSYDGINYTSCTNSDIGAYNGYHSDIAYGNGRLVVIGMKYSNPYSKYSTDGITWTTGGSLPSSTRCNYRLIYGNSIFMAVGVDGNVYTSSDGNTWTKKTIRLPLNSNYEIENIVYGNGKFGMWSIGVNKCFVTSDNGDTWTTLTFNDAGTGDIPYLYAVGFVNGQFIAENYPPADTTSPKMSRLYTSSDLIHWTEILTRQYTNGQMAYGNIAYGMGKVVEVGYGTNRTFFSRYSSDSTLQTWSNGTQSGLSGAMYRDALYVEL